MSNPEYAARSDAVHRESLARSLAHEVLRRNESVWRPDFLSRELADEIAWEIGARATVEPAHLKGVRSSDAGDSFAIRLHETDNVVDFRSRQP